MKNFDVVVIGGGPAGLAAAISAKRNGAKTLLIERESRLGGILKQCIHDGFGVVRFNENLSGPEYAERFMEELESKNIQVLMLTFVTNIEKTGNGFAIKIVNKQGVQDIRSNTIVLATGCRERTAKQVFIHGTRPSGVFTAGTAQHFTNLLGQMPTKKCVILGSGDIGLIMARRFTLEGAKVIGVYEAKPTPSGLSRNVHQCLNDYGIPLHLSHTVTRVFGDERLTSVEISKVDDKMQPTDGTQKIVECDALILSVGLIPENELAQSIGVEIDPRTKGPLCDEKFMTSVDGVFSCGNALHVNDLVDYVSESGEVAGKAAALHEKKQRSLVKFEVGANLLYFVPQSVDIDSNTSNTIFYFRSKDVLNNSKLSIKIEGKTIFEKGYAFLRPPEMERIELDFSSLRVGVSSKLSVDIEGGTA
ncbi:MAG TPA: NAD(P)/FAD-dependent oxidoreductase [Clostridia bacterium]|nr:NAD(P)/FAD-dependent oxidoreductase [Clostridia bacterium]